MGVTILPNLLPISAFNKAMNADKKIVDEGTLIAIEKQVDEFLAFWILKNQGTTRRSETFQNGASVFTPLNKNSEKILTFLFWPFETPFRIGFFKLKSKANSKRLKNKILETATKKYVKYWGVSFFEKKISEKGKSQLNFFGSRFVSSLQRGS